MLFFNSLIDFNLHDYFCDSEDIQHIEIFCTFKMKKHIKNIFLGFFSFLFFNWQQKQAVLG